MLSVAPTYETLKVQPLDAVRHQIRAGHYTAHTAGLAEGFLQTNVVILPQRLALDFMRFCQRNPRPCPLVGVSDTGHPLMATLGGDIDIRTDVPRYNVYRNGTLAEEVTDIRQLWRDDFVAFALGCSFTFEHALMRAGHRLRHIENNSTVPMFRTNRDTVRAGPFGGSTVVSMRALPKNEIPAVRDICARYPHAHGAPVYWGDPAEIGISDIARPDWGDPTPVNEGEVPVFWACGVTPQVALEKASPEICITHTPGHMLITEIKDEYDQEKWSEQER